MPWTVEDVEGHKKGLTDKQKGTWVKIANSALEDCLGDGGEQDACEGRAIRIANAALNEAAMIEAEAETKSEDGQEFPRGDYAYTPDGPSTWKLRLTATPGGEPDAGIVGAACAALGKGFRGKKAQIPAEDRAAVIAKVRAAWRKANPDKEDDDMPDVIKEAENVALDGELMPLVEKAVRNDGTIPIRIIAPGWGSSGYYPADVLERDGPKVFKAGMHTYWNHPTKTEERERPERDLRDLAGTLTRDAYYDANGPVGPGLYSEAKVTGSYRQAIKELAPHIGVSIRAYGKVREGEADGKKGKVIEELASAKSVDYVTAPGAGGRILELFEAAGRGESLEETEVNAVNEQEAQALREENEGLKQQLGQLTESLGRLREAQLLRRAQDIATEIVAGIDMPEPTRQRVVTAQANKPVRTENGELDEAAYRTQVQEAAQAELAYINEVRGTGKITGMGASAPAQGVALKESYTTYYRRLGKTQAEADRLAELAVQGS